jgi:hypothetical protein
VEVHEGQESGRPLDDVLEQLAADPAVAKDVVLEPVAAHPPARRAAPALGGDGRADVVERREVPEVGAAGFKRALQRMDVAVGQA